MATADEEFIKQLREVFDLCDELKCGIISVDQLRDIVRKHFGGSEEVCELYNILYLYTMFTWMFVYYSTCICKIINISFLNHVSTVRKFIFPIFFIFIAYEIFIMCAALSM